MNVFVGSYYDQEYIKNAYQITCQICNHRDMNVLTTDDEEVNLTLVHLKNTYHIECKNCGSIQRFKGVYLDYVGKPNQVYLKRA